MLSDYLCENYSDGIDEVISKELIRNFGESSVIEKIEEIGMKAFPIIKPILDNLGIYDLNLLTKKSAFGKKKVTNREEETNRRNLIKNIVSELKTNHEFLETSKELLSVKNMGMKRTFL